MHMQLLKYNVCNCHLALASSGNPHVLQLGDTIMLMSGAEALPWRFVGLPSLALRRTVLATIFSSSMVSWGSKHHRPDLVAGLAMSESSPTPPHDGI